MHRLIVLFTAAAGAVFVFAAAGYLPETVASQFGLSGGANRHTSRAAFLVGMAALVGLVPTLVWWLKERAIRMGKLKIPNAAHWLSAMHKATTERWMRGHTTIFCVVTTLFLVYVYWLVVQANQVSPPVLPAGLLWPALISYVLGVSVWVAIPYVRFRRTGDA